MELRHLFSGSVKIVSANADRVWICNPEPWLHTINSFQSFIGGGANWCLKIKCFFVKFVKRGTSFSYEESSAILFGGRGWVRVSQSTLRHVGLSHVSSAVLSFKQLQTNKKSVSNDMRGYLC